MVSWTIFSNGTLFTQYFCKPHFWWLYILCHFIAVLFFVYCNYQISRFYVVRTDYLEANFCVSLHLETSQNERFFVIIITKLILWCVWLVIPGVESKCRRCTSSSWWTVGTVAVDAECCQGFSDKVGCETETPASSVISSAHWFRARYVSRPVVSWLVRLHVMKHWCFSV